jgi:hypothetical protein
MVKYKNIPAIYQEHSYDVLVQQEPHSAIAVLVL